MDERGHTLEFSRHKTPYSHQKAATLQPLSNRIVMPPKLTFFDKRHNRLLSYTNVPVAKRSDTQQNLFRKYVWNTDFSASNITYLQAHVCKVVLLLQVGSSSILLLAASIYFYTIKSSGKESIFSLLLKTRVNILSVFIILLNFKWQRKILPFILLPIAVNKHK